MVLDGESEMKPKTGFWLGVAMSVIGFVMFIFADRIAAKEVFSKMLANGAVIVLTDEPCDLTYQGKTLMGKRSYGTIDGQTHKSCWHFKKGSVYIVWYESDGKTISGVNKYDASTFNEVKPL